MARSSGWVDTMPHYGSKPLRPCFCWAQPDAGEVLSGEHHVIIYPASMEEWSRWRWISVICFSRPVALKFGDQGVQFLFRQVTQIALRQVGTAALKFGIFDEEVCQKLHHFLSRLGHALLLTWSATGGAKQKSATTMAITTANTSRRVHHADSGGIDRSL
jgi:hypothetical protein